MLCGGDGNISDRVGFVLMPLTSYFSIGDRQERAAVVEIIPNSLVLVRFQRILLTESYCEGKRPCADFKAFTDGASRTP